MSAMNYEALRRWADERGVSARDLLVLSPQNDPFNCGSPADIERAQWFAKWWKKLGYGHGVHVRRVHYGLLSHTVEMRNGKPYENTEECWGELNICAKAARYLGLVPIGAFDDRRNPEPQIRLPDVPDYTVQISGGLPSDYIAPGSPTITVGEFSGAQSYHLEVWCEKSTMNDVLQPLCQSYNATLVTGLGELSITAVHGLIKRARQSGCPVRVFYVSDFDPGGRSMPVAVARKAEWMIRTEGLAIDLKIFATVLTVEQIRKFQLPRIPIKESERRRGSFERQNGVGGTELDALEALHPGELRRILAAEMERYYDRDLDERVSEARASFATGIRQAVNVALSDLRERMDDAAADYRSIADQCAGLNEQHADLYTEALDRVRHVELPDPNIHVGDLVEEDVGEALFDSSRSYDEQLEHYRRFQHGSQESGA